MQYEPYDDVGGSLVAIGTPVEIPDPEVRNVLIQLYEYIITSYLYNVFVQMT